MVNDTRTYKKEKIEKALQYIREGKTYKEIEKIDPSTSAFITKELGGFIPFLISNGIDYEKYVSPAKVTMYKVEVNTKDDLDRYLQINFKGKKSVKEKDIEPWAVILSKKYYGSYSKALRKNGATPMHVSEQELKEIEAEIINMYLSGISTPKIGEHFLIPQSAAVRVLKSNDIEVDHTKFIEPYMSKEEVDEFLFNFIEMYGMEGLSSDEIIKLFPKEVRSIKKIYGNIRNGFTKCGAYVLDKKVPKAWSRDFFINQIKIALANGYPINCDYINRNASSALDYARKEFGSWRNALESAGVNYDDLLKTTHMHAYYGRVFENILGDILAALNIDYQKPVTGKLRPDFVVGNEWIDAKLSYNTVFSSDCETIGKYENHCDKLTIIYLRGAVVDEMVTEKTRIVHVSYYLNKLPETDRIMFENRLRGIEETLAV